jgi:hypothetical protein
MGIACSPGFHRHIQTCARCGVSDLTVASTTTRDGHKWPPTCSTCSAVIREKSSRILAVERAVGA